MTELLTQTAPLTRLTYTVEEAGLLLGISRNHAYDLVKSGKIQAVRLGHAWRVPRVTIDRILAGDAQIPA